MVDVGCLINFSDLRIRTRTPFFYFSRPGVGLQPLHTHFLTFKLSLSHRSIISLYLSQSHNSSSFFHCLILIKILPRSLVLLTDLPVSSHLIIQSNEIQLADSLRMGKFDSGINRIRIIQVSSSNTSTLRDRTLLQAAPSVRGKKEIGSH